MPAPFVVSEGNAHKSTVKTAPVHPVPQSIVVPSVAAMSSTRDEFRNTIRPISPRPQAELMAAAARLAADPRTDHVYRVPDNHFDEPAAEHQPHKQQQQLQQHDSSFPSTISTKARNYRAKIIKISSVPNLWNMYDTEEAEQSAQAKENEMFYDYAAWRLCKFIYLACAMHSTATYIHRTTASHTAYICSVFILIPFC